MGEDRHSPQYVCKCSCLFLTQHLNWQPEVGLAIYKVKFSDSRCPKAEFSGSGESQFCKVQAAIRQQHEPCFLGRACAKT